MTFTLADTYQLVKANLFDFCHRVGLLSSVVPKNEPTRETRTRCLKFKSVRHRSGPAQKVAIQVGR